MNIRLIPRIRPFKVTRGHWNRHGLGPPSMISYLCSIENLSPVFEVFDFKIDVTLKSGLGVRQGHWKCHHSIERM